MLSAESLDYFLRSNEYIINQKQHQSKVRRPSQDFGRQRRPAASKCGTPIPFAAILLG